MEGYSGNDDIDQTYHLTPTLVIMVNVNITILKPSCINRLTSFLFAYVQKQLIFEFILASDIIINYNIYLGT